MSDFNSLLSNKQIHLFLEESGFTSPTAVQNEVIPQMKAKAHVSVLAQTGTGKTLSYLLPMFEMLKESEAHHTERAAPRALIVAPTRELARQLQMVAKSIAHHAKFRVRALLGGENKETLAKLKRESFDILIGVPGKVGSFIEKKYINLEHVEFFIMDEADQLLEGGFKKDLTTIVGQLPDDAQFGLFSATMPENYRSLRQQIFSGETFKDIELYGKHAIKKEIKTYNIFLQVKEKVPMLSTFVNKYAKGDGVIFVNRKEEVNPIKEELLKTNPKLQIYSIHGEMSAVERKKQYDGMVKSGGVIICTDIVARGLDLKNLQWVLNYDLPFEAVYYIHRCGRVARGGSEGFAYNFVTPQDFIVIERINKALQSQTALKLEAIDTKRFNKNKPQETKLTKLEKKKIELKNIKQKIGLTKKVKKIEKSKTPRYKRVSKKK